VRNNLSQAFIYQQCDIVSVLREVGFCGSFPFSVPGRVSLTKRFFLCHTRTGLERTLYCLPFLQHKPLPLAIHVSGDIKIV
jgi:hypothetical protein